LQVASKIGAQIFATVEDDSKAQFIHTHFDIALSRIFNTTDSSFVDAIDSATKGRGVDLVLNPLPGETLQASWDCIADFGKLIEMNKKKTIRGRKLDISPNRIYCSVDLGRLERQRPKLMNR
jgi:NADPH:quinone reductase-like Zn-dependent oxidoreductase